MLEINKAVQHFFDGIVLNLHNLGLNRINVLRFSFLLLIVVSFVDNPDKSWGYYVVIAILAGLHLLEEMQSEKDAKAHNLRKIMFRYGWFAALIRTYIVINVVTELFVPFFMTFDPPIPLNAQILSVLHWAAVFNYVLFMDTLVPEEPPEKRRKLVFDAT